MTNFNSDPRVRDLEPNTTALGPNFPGSINDLWRMVFRPSQNFMRYVTMAITNDDGSKITAEVEDKLDAMLTELQTMNAALAQLLAEAKLVAGQSD